MRTLVEDYDIVVVGAGHAGCEAALAGARLGLNTVMFTVSVDSIALMPCNPNVGGSSKGHLVRELDALGGEMGKNIDKTFIQSKMLNCSKGPAVHSLRAQADKQAYSNEMRKTLENTPNLTIKQGEVTKLLVEDGKITGVKTYSGATYNCKAVVLCTGTYLKARCIYGDVSNYTGPNGLQAANYLTDSLKELGIEMFRFKTGTPARIAGNHGDKLLLTRYANRPFRGYALIAGFVEIGETLEDTVHREVMEEVGVKVKNLRYYKNQPWAFTDTLLTGFYCELDGDPDITLDHNELCEGVWLSREEIPSRENDISLTAEMIERFRKGEE